jgi:hypothetical protein
VTIADDDPVTRSTPFGVVGHDMLDQFELYALDFDAMRFTAT